jgi:hypothetical protein
VIDSLDFSLMSYRRHGIWSVAPAVRV